MRQKNVSLTPTQLTFYSRSTQEHAYKDTRAAWAGFVNCILRGASAPEDKRRGLGAAHSTVINHHRLKSLDVLRTQAWAHGILTGRVLALSTSVGHRQVSSSSFYR